MFNLIGINEHSEYGFGGWTGNIYVEEVIVATFSTKKAAKDYVKASRWKKKKTGFRPDSLLRDFQFCEIEEVEDETPPPHDPVF